MGKSLDKAMKLLNFVAEEQRTLTELADASGIPKSSVHRLLNELLEQNLLTQNNKHYRLGVKLLELGEKVKRQLQVPQVAEERMRAAARRTGETLHLGVLDQRDIVYLAKVDGGRSLQMASCVGLRSPAQTTAMGKVLIAALPEGEWSRLFQPSVPRTPNTIIDREPFVKELRHVCEHGYALDREENEIGVRCVAAPVKDATGRTVAAISISGAAVYISDERQRELIPEVLSCSQSISRDLGNPS